MPSASDAAASICDNRRHMNADSHRRRTCVRLTRVYRRGALAARQRGRSAAATPPRTWRRCCARAAATSSFCSTATDANSPAPSRRCAARAFRRVVGAARAVDRESPFAITLVQCVPRGDRMDFIVQKATELGVARIVPVLSQRSVVRLDESQSESKQAHWRAVAVSACEQCGRNRLPTRGGAAAAAQLPWGTAARHTGPAAGVGARARADPRRGRVDGAAPWPVSRAEIAIGPEGGFAPDELEAFRLIGVLPSRPRAARAAHRNRSHRGNGLAAGALWRYVGSFRRCVANRRRLMALASRGYKSAVNRFAGMPMKSRISLVLVAHCLLLLGCGGGGGGGGGCSAGRSGHHHAARRPARGRRTDGDLHRDRNRHCAAHLSVAERRDSDRGRHGVELHHAGHDAGGRCGDVPGRVTNSAGSVTSSSATLTVTAGTTPARRRCNSPIRTT